MRTVRSSRKKFAIRSLWFTELCVLIVSVMAAARLRFHADPIALDHFVEGIAVRSVLVALCLTGAMLTFGLYQAYVRHSRIDLLLRIAFSFALGGVALLVIYYVMPGAYSGRGVLAMSLAIENVVSEPRVISICLPVSTTSINLVGFESRSTMLPASFAACVPLFIATATSA